MNRREKARKDHLTLGEAAEYSGLSERTIKRLAQAGQLTKYRQPGRRDVLYARDELDAVLSPQPVSA